MNKPDSTLGLTAKPSPNTTVIDLGPKGPVGPPGVMGEPGLLVAGLDGPQHPPAAAVPTTEPKVKSFIILIRHITKGTLHVVTKGASGVVVEFEEMEHALNAAIGIPGCQQNPHFIQPIYE